MFYIPKLNHLAVFAKDIKLSHSIFALPFVFVGILISPIDHISIKQCFLILLSMVSARSYAMGLNRYLDRSYDQLNPRTKNRAIPKKDIEPQSSLNWSLFFGLIFIMTSSFFNLKTCLLSIPLLGILGSYSLSKRFTFLCHLYLGFCLGLAPIGASMALTGTINTSLIYLSLAILFWTAGFDIIYATQDIVFDKKYNLQSIPSIFGIQRSILISSLFFALMIFFLILCGYTKNCGWLFYLGVFIVSCILSYEIFLLRNLGKKNSHINITKIFFDMNAWVSVLFYFFVQLDHLFI